MLLLLLLLLLLRLLRLLQMCDVGASYAALVNTGISHILSCSLRLQNLVPWWPAHAQPLKTLYRLASTRKQH